MKTKIIKNSISILLISTSLSSFAFDGETKVIGACNDHKFYGKGESIVKSGHYFAIKNNTSSQQYFNAMIKVCLQNGKCTTKEINHIHQNPNGYFVSPYYQLYLTGSYDRAGTYYFTASTDITGYKVLHNEQTCKVIIEK